MLTTLGLLLLLAAPAQNSLAAPNIQVPPHLPVANLPPGLMGPDVQLALKNGSILALRTYRFEGDMVHYRNVFGGISSVPLSHVDMERSKKLNADRLMPFGM